MNFIKVEYHKNNVIVHTTHVEWSISSVIADTYIFMVRKYDSTIQYNDLLLYKYMLLSGAKLG